MLIDSQVRIILDCQNRSICRGPNSLFARLRREGINNVRYCYNSRGTIDRYLITL